MSSSAVIQHGVSGYTQIPYGNFLDKGMGQTLAAETGVFALTGQDAGLRHNKVLLAETGIFVLTGQDANLVTGLFLSAENGVFALTGQDVGFIKTHILESETGSFVLTGYDANLIYSGAPPFPVILGDITFESKTKIYSFEN